MSIRCKEQAEPIPSDRCINQAQNSIEEQNANLSSTLRSLISGLRSLEISSVGLRFVISLALAYGGRAGSICSR
ncbi:hypothetical protein N7519_007910 [Penicillium mononematosum]|uniref:uncharacterized protein n=1 Tax=Penicillium mononematosum TaxID=268346 RepID=UPI00254872BF|nr:uncharacterized protein N7519_007910 [Penicillium mononematosum]KAJ6186609.1 hypothetical protein N7519_007910 [Penicillium mononematosum]